MKGVVFTEFLELVAAKFSEDMVDDVIEDSELASGGVYTTIGTYPHGEMLTLVANLSTRAGIPVPDLLQLFGKHLFGRFAASHPTFFVGIDDAFTFLSRVHGYIHVEVRKLYPEAELPSFEYTHPAPGQLVMLYESKRGLADLAQGLIEGCIEFYGENISTLREDLDGNRRVRFTMVRG